MALVAGRPRPKVVPRKRKKKKKEKIVHSTFALPVVALSNDAHDDVVSFAN
jgi:hypothetical protein